MASWEDWLLSPALVIGLIRWEAFFIGIVAGLVVIWGLDALEYLRIDDPIGAVPVHLVAGIWGTLSLGLFAAGTYGAPTPTGASTSSVVTGLFYGGGFTQLGLQALGSFSTVAATLVVSLVLMFALKRVGVLRVSKEGELEGLDLSEHGVSAYPEYALAVGASPSDSASLVEGVSVPGAGD
jgi:Amt family ammonium transporter